MPQFVPVLSISLTDVKVVDVALAQKLGVDENANTVQVTVPSAKFDSMKFVPPAHILAFQFENFTQLPQKRKDALFAAKAAQQEIVEAVPAEELALATEGLAPKRCFVVNQFKIDEVPDAPAQQPASMAPAQQGPYHVPGPLLPLPPAHNAAAQHPQGQQTSYGYLSGNPHLQQVRTSRVSRLRACVGLNYTSGGMQASSIRRAKHCLALLHTNKSR